MSASAGPRPGAYRALVLATLAFALCFAVWGLVSPLATRFQELYELSSTQISVVIATLRGRNGTVRRGVGAGRPSLERADQVCEAILALSGTTNGRLSVEGFKQMESRTGVLLADLSEERGEELITFADITTQPRKVIASPEWSGTESRTRRYSPFTINVDRSVPWRTLTGRQQFYLDHEWMLEYGEGLPAYRPPMRMAKHTVLDAEVQVDTWRSFGPVET